MGDNWGGAFESETTSKRPIDEHVQNTLIFVQKHEEVLHSIDSLTRTAISETCESHSRPIRAAYTPLERVLPQDIISTENDQLRKVLTVLIFLCDEIAQLKEIAESRFYRPLIMFGQSPPELVEGAKKGGEDTVEIPGKKEKMIGQFLPFLQELSNFIDRCYAVALNLVQQMASLHNPKDILYKTTFKHTHLHPMFRALGDLLAILVTFDAIISQNEYIEECWTAYKSMISYSRVDPAAFDTTIEKIAKFERLLVAVDQGVMIGEIFKGCIEQNFENHFPDEGASAVHVNVRGNQSFLDGELLYNFKLIIEQSLAVIGTNSELNERENLVGAMAMYVLYRRLVPPNIPPDAKLYKVLWGIQKTVPVVVLCENVMWIPSDFLTTYAHFEVKKLDPPVPETHRRQYLAAFDQALAPRTHALVAQCKAWMILAEGRLQSSLRNENNIPQLLDLYGSICLKGLSLCSRASYLARSCLVMHEKMQVPLARSGLEDITRLVECIKAMEYTFVRKDNIVAESLPHIHRNICAGVVNLIEPMKLRLEGIRKLDAGQSVLHASLTCLDTALRSSDSLSSCRQVTMGMLMDIAVHATSLCSDEVARRMRSLVNRLMKLANLQKDLSAVCETTYLYFHTALLDPIVSGIYQLPTEANRLQYVFSAYEDGIKMCQAVLHSPLASFYKNYRDSLRETLKFNVIQPLCRDIENDLRLHIHTKHLDHMQALNPKTENLRPLTSFIDLPPLRILGLIVDIKNEVTHYLDMNFYNLTSVALHDWRTYSDMRSLAQEKFGLTLMDNFLPMGSLDQGLDVLQIMRNIHVFVGRFTYNMNMQQFVEFRPDKASKHLNTIKIQSIAASIRQHGLGVLNTTVNFTYQFLSSKFKIFSQFLFDDYIRAHLSREHRWYKKHKNQTDVNNMYPYERALKFVKDIRKLGVNESGKSFLDQFRILITEIGNALGYVRMVRSASMYYCSEAVKFLPEFEDIIKFEEYAGLGRRLPSDPENPDSTPGEERMPGTGANLSEETVRSAKNLDACIDTLVRNFGEGSDYFKVLVSVFQSVLLNSEHDHLKTFYMIVPALCISWIDASLLAKDAMYKTTRGVTKEMYYTDDGFAVGVAYCLAILKQSRKNEGTHWIESVNKKIKLDAKDLADKQARRAQKEAALAEAKAKAKKKSGGFFGFGGKKVDKSEEEIALEEQYEDQEEIHTLQMTSKKLEAYRRETQQLFYSMTGAEIFFKRTDVDT